MNKNILFVKKLEEDILPPIKDARFYLALYLVDKKTEYPEIEKEFGKKVTEETLKKKEVYATLFKSIIKYAYMIYKFRRWVYVPCVTEVFISANTDSEALEINKNLDPKSLSWKECPMSAFRSTYEVIKSDDKKS